MIGNAIDSIVSVDRWPTSGARTGLLHLLITDEPTAAVALALISGGSTPGLAAAL